MSNNQWRSSDISDQSGRVVIVTGANTGLGLETSRELAKKNAHVVMAVRSAEKGKAAAASILAEYPSAKLEILSLDLADLASIKAFTKTFNTRYDRLDTLVNNAGVMQCPYALTRDGFEMQFGTNHLGHFALTALLLPALRGTAQSRIVVVSSLAHRFGNPDISDPNWSKRKYNAQQAYNDSKLANLFFSQVLAQKLSSSANNPLVVAAHPGWTMTDLMRHEWKVRAISRLVAQSTSAGALPILRAAVDKDARAGDFYGPAGLGQFRGAPIKVQPFSSARNTDLAEKVWKLSEQMTGINY